jgi:hypothetical protein
MVSYMMPTLSHEFVDEGKDPWLEPRNRLYLV